MPEHHQSYMLCGKKLNLRASIHLSKQRETDSSCALRNVSTGLVKQASFLQPAPAPAPALFSHLPTYPSIYLALIHHMTYYTVWLDLLHQTRVGWHLQISPLLRWVSPLIICFFRFHSPFFFSFLSFFYISSLRKEKGRKGNDTMAVLFSLLSLIDTGLYGTVWLTDLTNQPTNQIPTYRLGGASLTSPVLFVTPSTVVTLLSWPNPPMICLFFFGFVLFSCFLFLFRSVCFFTVCGKICWWWGLCVCVCVCVEEMGLSLSLVEIYVVALGWVA